MESRKLEDLSVELKTVLRLRDIALRVLPFDPKVDAEIEKALSSARQQVSRKALVKRAVNS